MSDLLGVIAIAGVTIAVLLVGLVVFVRARQRGQAESRSRFLADLDAFEAQRSARSAAEVQGVVLRLAAGTPYSEVRHGLKSLGFEEDHAGYVHGVADEPREARWVRVGVLVVFRRADGAPELVLAGTPGPAVIAELERHLPIAG